jgi:hypothetical protein
MFRYKNLKRDHIKVGCSIINVNKKRRQKSPNENKYVEIKIRDMSIDNKRKIKPLSFKL